MRAVRLRPTGAVRVAVFLTGDLLIWVGALVGAYLIRFDGAIPARYLADVPLLLAVLIPIKLGWHVVYRLYSLTWRAVGLNDFINIVKANTLALGTMTAVVLAFRRYEVLGAFPRSVLLLDYVLTTCAVTLFRASRRGWRLQREALRMRRHRRGASRLLLVGAGAAGTRIAQTLEESGDADYHLVGFVDDDPAKHGAYIRGLRVHGGREVLPRIVREQQVDEVLVAVPSAPLATLREIIDDVRRAGVRRIKVLPGMHEWLAGRAAMKDIREVRPHDLLGRPPVRIQYDALKTYFAGKRVLVTGAAGSVGSELVRQLVRLGAGRVVAVDLNESGLFDLEQEFQRERSEAVLQTAIADVRDGPRVEWLMQTARPHLVFHAAAYKHVPMMEREVEEAVKTNVFGTLTVGEAALRSGVETFVFISTDKAVNPSSVMGHTKRAGELITEALGRRRQTRFLAVRFGNVLGSRGSIIPILQEQIRCGGPVTITHPEMSRFFMTIAEAALLVLQTPLMTSRSSIFMLDMGEPVRVVDLARELIRLSGLEPDKDIPIVYTGIRAGEKIEEELVMPHERLTPTAFERILEVRSNGEVDEVTLRLILRELEQLVRVMDSEGVRALLARLTRNGPEPGASVTSVFGGLPAAGGVSQVAPRA
ncbi:MAG: nucleoside-diphosphate sugar epimerase/dehydratase [Armatimonadota bacterium]|nr:nucleoside-diphosphate sugar epimerase/dehydratase [Armatimonadota bacterium]